MTKQIYLCKFYNIKFFKQKLFIFKEHKGFQTHIYFEKIVTRKSKCIENSY